MFLKFIPKQKVIIFTLVFSFLLVLFFSVSFSEATPRFIPVETAYHLYPAEVELRGWEGSGAFHFREVSEDGLYQFFSKSNSIYLSFFKDKINTSPSFIDYPDFNVTGGTTTDGQISTSTIVDNDILDFAKPDEEVNEIIEEESEGQVSAENSHSEENIENKKQVEVTAEPASVPEVKPVSNKESSSVEVEETVSSRDDFGVFSLSRGFFRFLSQTTTNTIPLDNSPEIENNATETLELISHENTNAEAIQTSSDENVLSEIEEVYVETLTEFPAINENPIASSYENEITLRNFGLPTLGAGQKIDVVQLRMSLGGLYLSDESETYPYLDIGYSVGEFKGKAGSILLDGEFSNALNGGYFLLPLPTFANPADLHDLEIFITYEGDLDNLVDLYIDSAWLEVTTKSYTRQALEDRMQNIRLAHLERTKLSELVSNRFNFLRDELPVFSMRYESQRNFIIRAARSLLGRDVAVIEKVTIKHRDLGELGLSPEINVTRDGLISIQLKPEDKERLRPGLYTVTLEIDEGGKIFNESFDFQWGMLSMNTNQTEYMTGQTVDISLGALSPNGNTVCDANLELYVVSPDDSVSKQVVTPSGLCNGNNVIDVPDYSSNYIAETVGAYEIYLERLDDKGEVISFTKDSFVVAEDHDFALERNGPTRIYPLSPYTMEISLHTYENFFDGWLIEQVPASFEIFNTDAEVVRKGEYKELRWNLNQVSSSSQTVSYEFDAPNISPYLFNLGEAKLVEGEDIENEAVFTEHRRWQIASDAVGNMILYWTDPSSIPSGWTCLSCGSGTFFERFSRGGDTYNITGGSLTHTHTALGSVAQTTSGGVVESRDGTTFSDNDHTHTYTPTIGSASNLPVYRTLRVIQYTGGAGEPSVIPEGAVAIFDTSVPDGWTRYSAHDGYYIYANNTVGSTGGSNTHTHSITGSLSTPGGGTLGRRGGGTQVGAAGVDHTHTVNSTTGSVNHEPPYIQVILGRIDADGAPPVGMISMWTEDVPAGWIDVSSAGSAPFNGRFLKAATSYGAIGGSETNSHNDVFGITAPISGAGTQTGQSGSFGSPTSHTHLVDVTNFSEANHLPPYITAVFGKRIGLDATFTQANYRWYVNRNNQTPDDPWSEGMIIDVEENEPISIENKTISSGDIVRLRLNVAVGNATSSIGTEFKLQYSEASVCEGATAWTDVGTAGSGEIWRGYNNTSVSDGGTLTDLLLSSSTVAFTYQENGYTVGVPDEVSVGGYGEWDFVIQNNGASTGSEYCFRVVYDDNSLLFAYSNYPKLTTNGPPSLYQLIKRFDNENTQYLQQTFDFFAIDPEGDSLDYRIQIASDYDFSSVVVDRNTDSHLSQFENQVSTSEKNPFSSGQTIRFTNNTNLTNGTTYWWRVSARDTEASGEWGEWSNPDSFTVSVSLDASGWYQNEDEQFSRGNLNGVEVYGSNQVRLISGSSTGSLISPPIDFNHGEEGTAWDNFYFSHNVTNGSITYHLQYRDEQGDWHLIPNTDLAGNSTGFTSSPVSLLSLEVSTYRFIRIVAIFENIGGTPYLEEWGVDWGYRVDTPSLSSPFPNEKVGTTTPTFIFSTSDPKDNDLTYQVSWSTDPTFSSGVTTRTSDTDSGFTNLNNGADTDPFNSGESILFKIQDADTLTNGTTYWWRVRAKDTTGNNEYSFWTTPISFTVDNTVTVSTWYQTTSEQFSSNILSGTTGVSGGVTVSTIAEEAMIVYGEGSVTTPRYRLWNGSGWSDEGSLLNINSATRWVVTRAGVTREEYVAGVIGANGFLTAQVFSLGEWNNQQTMTTSIGSTATRGFDIAYESVTGRAIVVYCDGDANPSYRIWNGSSWSSETSITSALTSDCRWVEMASNPTSDAIVLVLRGVNDTPYQALVWNGATWGNSTTLGTARNATYSGIGVGYEESGDQAVVVAPSAGGGPNRMVYRTWNGSTWSAETTQTIGGRLFWADIVPNIGSDAMVLCYINDNSEVRAIRWTGSAWAGDTQFTAAVNSSADPAFACVYENGGSRNNYILGAYGDTTQTNYRNWNTSTWSGATQVNSIGRSATMQLIRTGNNLILGTFFDYLNSSLRFATWNGTAWSTTQTLEDSTSVTTSPYGLPYYMAARNPGSSGSVVVSPPISFTDGMGPYFDEFSWNHTLPGSSEITYHMQYLNDGVWEFIPDEDLSGNVAGFTTSPVDLSDLNVSTYHTIRPYASLECDGVGNCPTLNNWTVIWAEGISVSGTLQEYDKTTNVNSGTVAVAVNGVLQVGKTGTVSSGSWSIDNVTAFADDILTIFLSGASNANEAIVVVRYDGVGNMTDIGLYERHLTLYSDDEDKPITNSNIGLYDFSNTEDIFADVSGGTLRVCADTGCADAKLYIPTGSYYQPGGRVITHDFENDGTFVSGAFTHDVSGSWLNNGVVNMTDSTVVMTAESGTELLFSNNHAFNHLTFGTTTGNATWQLQDELEINGNLTVQRGTLDRGGENIILLGSLINSANGNWTGIGTTTFTGSGVSNWSDSNSTLQNVGSVVLSATTKTIVLTGNVMAESITINSGNTLDPSTNNHSITVNGNWYNGGTFIPRAGNVRFISTNPNQTITRGGSNFANLTFNGFGGSWSFTESSLNVNNTLTIDNGIVTLPTATTTIGASFLNNGGTFVHNNGVIIFSGSGSNNITLSGGEFTNHLYNVIFSGSGNWTFTEANATTSNNITINNGTVTLPSGVMAVGGNLNKVSGNISANNGELEFYSAGSQSVTTNGSSLSSVSFVGGGNYTLTDTNLVLLNDIVIDSGTVTLPTGQLTVGGSFINNDTFVSGAGNVLFNSNTLGNQIKSNGSIFNEIIINNSNGGWTITDNSTTTNNFSLDSANEFTVASGVTLAVGGEFKNHVGGANTTWTNSVLLLFGNDYHINNKTDAGDEYDTIRIENNANIKVWNSEAGVYEITGDSSLYSQNHAGVNGDLNIYGNYSRNTGTEYWSHNVNFDGAALSSGDERLVKVRIADGSNININNSSLAMTGTSTASTTVEAISGDFSFTTDNATITAQYFEIKDTDTNGLNLTSSTTLSVFSDGLFEVEPASTAISVDASTVDTNPAGQFYRIGFTTSGSAYNVTLSGLPSSYIWFRNGFGNLYGEAYDQGDGDPGSIRFDDSSYLVSVSGIVYSDAGQTIMGASVCDGTTPNVRIVVDGGTYTSSTSCDSITGEYVFNNVTYVGDPKVIVYLDTNGGEKGSVVTKTLTDDVSNMDIYANRVIVRHEDSIPLSISDMVLYDYNQDTDIQFVVSTGTPNTLSILPNIELLVFPNKTFVPNGDITINGDGNSNDYEGTLKIGAGSTFTATSNETHTLAGRLVATSTSVFNSASSTFIFNATTSGKSISSPTTLTFNHLEFNGVGGGWNIGANINVLGDMDIDEGIVTGTGNINLVNGSLSGNGLLSMGGGTVTLAKSNNLGGNTAWTFNNLTLGNGTVVGTTTPLFTSTTTILGTLTISNAHFLDAGNSAWDLAGTGNVLVRTGTLLEDTSTIRFSGAGANVPSMTYYNLFINSGSGSQNYTGMGSGILVLNDLVVGGDNNSTFVLNTNNPLLEVRGDVSIQGNGTIQASGSNNLVVLGDWINQGVFSSNNGTVRFAGSGTSNIDAGNSSFGNVEINGTGNFIVTNNATATNSWLLQNHNNFTVNSGQTLAVGGQFTNTLGGANTTWTGSTLSLFGNSTYTINASTIADNYGNLAVGAGTQIRMWNSGANTYDVNNNGSLYSQDHDGVNGDLYIWGNLVRNSGNDYWSYATDFDGTNLTGGSERQVNVYLADNAKATWTGGSLSVLGANTATTTIQNQGSGTYGLVIGGNTTTNWNFVRVRDVDSQGVVLTGTPTVTNFSRTDHLVKINSASAVTVGGTVINANPAKNFTNNIFAADIGVTGAVNVTATGTSVSSWRFTNHSGNIAGEAFDNDPAGDPGYIVWDDSAALITVSGNVYSDEGSIVSGACDGSTNNIRLVVAGLTTYDTSCNASTGAYSISNVSFGPVDTLTLFINGETQKAANVTVSPISSISDMHLYENRVIVRHENTDPITIANMTAYDSNDNADIPFTANTGSPNTLALPTNTKLLVWTGKTFEPNGNVTLSGTGTSGTHDGTLEVQTNGRFRAKGNEAHSIGGNVLFGTNAEFISASSTVTLTTAVSGRTVDVNDFPFHNLTVSSSGEIDFVDNILTINGSYNQSSGSVTLPTGTTTVRSSFNVTGGSVDTNSGLMIFSGAGAGNAINFNGSDFSALEISGTGSWNMTDVNATGTGNVIINSGTLSLPSGTVAIGGNLINVGGTITHNTSEIIMLSNTSTELRANNSDLHSVNFAGSGPFTITDSDITFLGSFVTSSGTVNMATGTTVIGGSLLATAGDFVHASGTILLNSATGGNTINVGSNVINNLQIGAPSGGYTLYSATTTNNFSIVNVNNLNVDSSAIITVGGVFTNTVGGSNTNWNDSTLILKGDDAYSINNKNSAGDTYGTLVIDEGARVRVWNSSATTTNVSAGSSLYSQDHSSENGNLYIYGNLNIGTTTEYWSYATDFDGTSLVGSERQVNVYVAENSTTTVNSGSLQIVGQVGNETTIQNQGSGTHSFSVLGGTFNANHYSFSDLDIDGLQLSNISSITNLANGFYDLAVDTGSLITLSSTTLNINPSKIFDNVGFHATSGLSGFNVRLIGETDNAWRFTNSYGNLSGESFDVDGIDACGSIRWDNSACLITEQTNVRWRNDNGGIGVPSNEWFDNSFDYRQRVRVVNNDNQTYASTSVKFTIAYDSDMKSDFSDLRFTDNDGITPIPFWVERYTASNNADVWVLVPNLPASSQSVVHMYYGSSTASSISDGYAVFNAFDDFEDNNISEYSGDTSLFTTVTSPVFGGSYALRPSNTSGKTTDGIFRFDQTVAQGQIIRYMQYVNTAFTSDEPCTLFGVQSPGTTNQNYAVCLEQFGTDRISLARDVENTDTSGTVLVNTPVTYSTGWYEVEIDWRTNNFINVNLYNSSGSLVANISATDSNYTSGGYGFAFWFQNGAWDSFTSRPRVNTKPSIFIGEKQQTGGADWLSEVNTKGITAPNEIKRLRVAIENSGLEINNQQFRLDFAGKGAAPTCESINPASFTPVPNVSSCGSSPICMANSSHVTNGDNTSDLLFGTKGEFVTGKVVSNSSNMTGNMDIDQNHYTELEYVLATNNNSNQPYCFRVTNNGTPLDFYANVAELELVFDPTFGTVALNTGLDISLTPGTTTQIYATGTVTDLNGYNDLAHATATIYRSGVGPTCSPDNNNCYILSTNDNTCSFTNCSGNSCTLSCVADIIFHADATDFGAYEGQEWHAFLEAEDQSAGYGFASASGVDLLTMRALTVDSFINYGSLSANSDTGSYNPTTTITNLGNTPINVDVQATDLHDGISSTIPAEQQKVATSTFTYNACVSCYQLSSDAPVTLNVNLNKPVEVNPPIETEVYWGIEVPFSASNASHTGVNLFTAIGI